jgi:hypothetical protein
LDRSGILVFLQEEREVTEEVLGLVSQGEIVVLKTSGFDQEVRKERFETLRFLCFLL